MNKDHYTIRINEIILDLISIHFIFGHDYSRTYLYIIYRMKSLKVRTLIHLIDKMYNLGS